MRGLVYIGKIIAIQPILGADFIELATVVCGEGGKWMGAVKKGQFNEGDKCQVYLQDSLLPHTEEFSFMEKYKWRVRMARFKGVPSEALIMPQSITGSIGTDVTAQAGVEKYLKPIPAEMQGIALGSFPAFIPKTDEVNFQSAPELVETLRGYPFYSTVKYDGFSATAYWRDGYFGCCSRNMELQRSDSNIIWRLASQYNLAQSLASVGYNLALQFEVIGPKINSNPLGLPAPEARLFNVYDIDHQTYLDGASVRTFAALTGLPMVEIIEWGNIFCMDSEQLRRYAEGVYPNGRQREGVVIRPLLELRVGHERLSFKVVNLLYKER